MKIIDCNNICKTCKIAILVSRFNLSINKNLLNGTIDSLTRIGCIDRHNITVIYVPGVLELPLVALKVASSKNTYDAIIAVGTVIMGNTRHSEYIAQTVIKNLSFVSLQYKIPITVGILTTRNIKQAIERSGTKLGNRGSDAAISALEMINILRNV